jgi:hypothetical protein
MRYAAFHSTEKGFKTQREVRNWIKHRADFETDKDEASKWRIVKVLELPKRKNSHPQQKPNE